MLRTRDKILEKARNLINGDRAKNYGPAKANHERIARIWSVIFGIEVSAQQVVLAMIGMKRARLANPLEPEMEHEDSWVDICGYGGIGGEITSAADLKVGAVEERTTAL